MKKLVMVLVMIAFACSTAFAGPKVEVDLNDLGSDARNAVLRANEKAEEAADAAATAKEGIELLKPENAEKLSDYATTIAKAVKETASALNVEVNEFVKTPVGMLTAGAISYKIFGKDIIVAATDTFAKWFGLMIGFPVIIWSYRRCHCGRKVKKITYNETGKVKIKVDEELVFKKWGDDFYACVSGIAHYGMIVVLTLIAILG